MAEALSLADRVAVRDQGALVACESPAAIARSADPRVRQLLDAIAIRLNRES
jgi:ABC-type proline/glycine betaine transport system ATPase subunit